MADGCDFALHVSQGMSDDGYVPGSVPSACPDLSESTKAAVADAKAELVWHDKGVDIHGVSHPSRYRWQTDRSMDWVGGYATTFEE